MNTEQQSKLSNEEERAIWMQCFTAAITGVLASRTHSTRGEPGKLVSWCAKIADAAAAEEGRRRG